MHPGFGRPAPSMGTRMLQGRPPASPGVQCCMRCTACCCACEGSMSRGREGLPLTDREGSHGHGIAGQQLHCLSQSAHGVLSIDRGMAQYVMHLQRR